MRMLITDVFHLSDGRSAFTVVPEGTPKLIAAGGYALEQDGKTIQLVQIENEVLSRTRRGHAPRSVSTAGRVNIPSGPPKQKLVLVSRS